MAEQSYPWLQGLIGPSAWRRNLIEIAAVSKIYDTSQRGRHVALSEISFDVAEGQFVSILGPSGCGKSTLLYIVGGFVDATSGTMRVSGAPVTGPGPDRGPVFQEFALVPLEDRARERHVRAVAARSVRKPQAAARARELLELVHLTKYEAFYPKELSGGMKQRVALARTLAYEPKILLMDEPFGALDALTRKHLQNELLEIWERDRKTVMFVTHSVEEAVFLSDRIFVMTNSPGRIRKVFDVALPRPRVRAELLVDRRYQEMVVAIEQLMDEQEPELS